MKKFLLMALVAVTLVTVSACSGGGGLQGTAEGYGGDLTVEVTVDGEDITNVEVVEHSETAGVSDPAIEQVPQAIVDADSTDVDTVSGATFTSEAIIKAVDNALATQE